ncbi:probable splicing factor, arginine/serine-rich 6 [Fopius arisanus]|uniref:Probable splicing factor, arginine/serine-rich 6 n=1 Tax=Fopius arisanus TaxID=64838 RepID=A0A9R1UBG5_9HYME|nr:PREDICTED: probable splicing factor, arginine/serine-rich 6 [Fopius arisanus]
MSRYREWDLSCKVYVGDLGSSASKHEIENVFSKYGPLRNVWVARNPPGFAFVEFEDPRDAEDAVRGLHGTRCCGTRVRVEMSSGRSRRGGGRRAGPRSRSRSPRRKSIGRYPRSLSKSPKRSPVNRYSRSRSRSPRRRSLTRSRSRDRRSRSDSRDRRLQITMSRYREWDLSCKVYVGNLGSSASKHEIENAFSQYGPLRNVWVARNPPGFAFVEFEDPRDAEDAVRGLHGKRCCGTRVRVEMSSGRSRRGGGGRRAGPRYSRSRSRSPRRRSLTRSRSRDRRSRSDSRDRRYR